MTKTSKGFLAPIILILLSLSGCGDLTETEVVKKTLESDRFNVGCKLDMDRISLIMDEEIPEVFECLEKNLLVFLDISELSRNDSLSKTALINYLERNEPDIKPSTYKILEAVFLLNYLITGEDKEYISRGSITKIINFAVVFNKQASTYFTRTFRSKQPATLGMHNIDRGRIVTAAQEIQRALEKIYVADRGDRLNRLNILDLVDLFLGDEDVETLEKIKSIIFAKSILLGGDKEILTHIELESLFANIPSLLKLALDVVRYEYLELDQASLLKLLEEDLSDFERVIYDASLGDRNPEVFFNLDEIIDAWDVFAEEGKGIRKYRKLIFEAKKILTSDKNRMSGTVYVLGSEFRTLLNHGLNILKKGIAFHEMYKSDVFQPYVELPTKIQLNPAEFEGHFPDYKEYLPDFCRIVSNYRFQAGKFESAYYSLDYRRNSNAVFEISMYEYVIRLVFGTYGSSLSMSNEQLIALFKKFQKELVELKLILPRRARGTADTISLLGSLFQFQSDNNKTLDVNEATEFMSSLLTAKEIGKKMFAFYQEQNCDYDDYGRFDPECFKEHFYRGMCEYYRPYYPRLFEFLGADPQSGCEQQDFNSEHNRIYLEAAAAAARTCNIYPDTKEEIYYNESDIFSIVLAMMHIETTILRWDINSNNFMDENEVMDAFAIYKPAIEGLLSEMSFLKPYSRQVYQYLVKYESVPALKDWKRILNFILNRNKSAPAHRKTIASILRIVSEQGKKKDMPPEDVFDCNSLHKPDEISLK